MFMMIRSMVFTQSQSRTGGVLGAVCHQQQSWPPAGFFLGGGKFRDAKKLTTFSVVTLKTQVFTVTSLLMHKFYNISRGWGKCPQNISFFSKGRLCSSKGEGASENFLFKSVRHWH